MRGEGPMKYKRPDNIVLMRTEECFLSVSQILALTNKSLCESKHPVHLIERVIRVKIVPLIVGVASSCFWISFEHGRILCKYLGQEQNLQSLVW